MIKNIVFDLGNVLLSWKPEQFLIDNGYNASKRDQYLNEIFKSPEWLALDNGDMDTRTAINTISKKSSLETAEIFAVFNLRTRILSPLTDNAKLLPGLKKAGFRLYYLSNFPEDIFDEVFSSHSFFGIFDGGIISARAKASKPDERIYKILLEKYSILPEETLFIDDTHVNAEAAKKLGLSVIHLSDHSKLKELVEDFLGISIEG